MKVGTRVTCAHTGKRVEYMKHVGKNLLCRDPLTGQDVVVLKVRRGRRAVAEDRTPCGAPIGGAMNPELVKLAKARCPHA